jgi:hypothetical protein
VVDVVTMLFKEEKNKMMGLLIKAAAMLCPAGKVILNIAPCKTKSTLSLLKGLQAELEQTLERHYTQISQFLAKSIPERKKSS